MTEEEKSINTKVDVSRRVLNYSMSVFFLLCSISVVLFVFFALPALEASRQLLEQTRTAEEKLSQSIHQISSSLSPILGSSGSFMAELSKTLQESRAANAKIINKAEDIQELIWEIGLASAAIALSEEGLIPGHEAEDMIARSLKGIEDRSPRLGQLARYINDARPKKMGKSSSHRNKSYDSAAKSALKNLATAQAFYYADNNTYTPNLKDMEFYGIRTDPDVSLHILQADQNKWKAIGRHKSSRSEFVYDSSRGGLQ